jgi:hypothetical protein
MNDYSCLTNTSELYVRMRMDLKQPVTAMTVTQNPHVQMASEKYSNFIK